MVKEDNINRIKIKKSHLKIAILVVLVLIGAFFLLGHSQNKQGSSSTNVVYSSIGKPAPDVTFTTIDGEERKLSDYRGEKVMFWYFATWCPSCIKAAEVLQQNNDKLNGMKIIALKTYGNAGYSGPTILEFSQKYSPNALKYDNWVWGDASQQATSTYNTQNYPDIYFLIDENGILRDVDSAPAATSNKIVNFAQE